MNQIWSNIPIPTQTNQVRIVIFIDNSGSMNEDVVQPAVNDFILSISQKGYTTKKQLCGTEQYLYWIYNTANGNVSC
jgi:predicted metal-dependent peptidase